MTTYIKLEDAKTLASELSGIPVNFLSKFDSLPSIDFEEMIKEMIEDELMSECSITKIRTIEDVLGKVKGVPPDRMELS